MIQTDLKSCQGMASQLVRFGDNRSGCAGLGELMKVPLRKSNKARQASFSLPPSLTTDNFQYGFIFENVTLSN